MPEQGSHHHFIQLLAALASAHQSVGDQFFTARLNRKTEELISGYFSIQKSEQSGDGADVAQYRKQFEHLKAVDSLIDLIEELRHLKMGRPLPLSIALDRLLRYRLNVGKNIKGSKPQTPAKKEKSEQSEPDEFMYLPSKPAVSQTAEKIVNYVRHASRARTKEIIDEFSALSERTVKRSLKELTQKGILKKIMKDRAMYYLVS